jgi:hypothetical protein
MVPQVNKIFFLLTLLTISLHQSFAQERELLTRICDGMTQGLAGDSLPYHISKLLLLSTTDSTRLATHPRQGQSVTGQSQAQLRTIYRMHLSLIDSCDRYPFKVFPFVGYDVLDFENVFTLKQTDELSSRIKHIAKEKGYHITLATISQYYPFETIEELGSNALKSWGIKGNRPKVLIILNPSKRQLYIIGNHEAGEGLSADECQQFLSKCTEVIKADGLYKGAIAGVSFICSVL